MREGDRGWWKRTWRALWLRDTWKGAFRGGGLIGREARIGGIQNTGQGFAAPGLGSSDAFRLLRSSERVGRRGRLGGLICSLILKSLKQWSQTPGVSAQGSAQEPPPPKSLPALPPGLLSRQWPFRFSKLCPLSGSLLLGAYP